MEFIFVRSVLCFVAVLDIMVYKQNRDRVIYFEELFNLKQM